MIVLDDLIDGDQVVLDDLIDGDQVVLDDLDGDQVDYCNLTRPYVPIMAAPGF